jgi:hypothetical protein
MCARIAEQTSIRAAKQLRRIPPHTSGDFQAQLDATAFEAVVIK